MRKGNQPNSADNRQLRVVGDHLGSTTLVVDTSTSPGPQVVHRQYYKPYGEIAYTTGSGQTSIGYTGQRLDTDSGLMYYGARFYDPVLSYFVSADPIAAEKTDPQSRNRYSYVLNNPLRYTDSSGYCVEPDKNSPEYKAGETCARSQEQLRRYGIVVDNMADWSLDELLQILDSIKRMMATLGWTSIEEFREAMGIDSLGSIYLTRIGGQPGGYYCGGYCASDEIPDHLTSKRSLGIYGDPSAYAKDPEWMGQLMVHELAHAWDHAAGFAPSNGMAARTGSYAQGDSYYAGGEAASEYGGSGNISKGRHGKREDWAEAVAGSVYPDRATYNYVVWGTDPRTGEHRTGMDKTRRSQVKHMGQLVTNTVNDRRRFYGGR